MAPLILAALVSVVSAQEPLDLPGSLLDPVDLSTFLQDPPVEEIPSNRGRRGMQFDFGLTAAVHARYSVPFGRVETDVDFTTGLGGLVVDDTDASWSDFFKAGWGLDLELDVLIGSTRRFGHTSRVGVYALFSVDRYVGESESGDSGHKVDPDDLNLATLMVGAKFSQPIEDIFVGEGRVGVGAVHYPAVDATYTGPAGLTAFRGEFLEETWAFAFEVKGHAGWKIGALTLTLGLGLRILAPPDEGNVIDLDPGAFWAADVELGASLGF